MEHLTNARFATDSKFVELEKKIIELEEKIANANQEKEEAA